MNGPDRLTTRCLDTSCRPSMANLGQESEDSVAEQQNECDLDVEGRETCYEKPGQGSTDNRRYAENRGSRQTGFSNEAEASMSPQCDGNRRQRHELAGSPGDF